MRARITGFILVAVFSACSACRKENQLINQTSATSVDEQTAALISETFESGVKTSYATGDVTLLTGSWNFNDALLGNTSSDVKDGNQSARVRNSGILSMNFDFTTGASTVTIKHALFGSDNSSTWQLWYSVNGGSSYIQTGSTITTNTTTLQTASFTLSVTGNIRFQIRKTDGSTSRINFDDFSVTSYASGNGPVLTSLTPDTATAGAKVFIMAAIGKNFKSASVINWNGVPLTTTYVSAKKIKAKIPAAYVDSAGVAGITVVTGTKVSATLSFTINSIINTSAKRFLFDATKAETVGNADWVIDEDNNVPKQIPTPAQSGITTSTSETYWTGALSSWGIALVKAGDYVETLPTSTAITYGNTSNVQDLSKYNVFVVDEPNTLFTSSEKTAIINFVQNGGGLFMISDHTQSDRNNDGYDSPAIWNDLMTNNSVKNNPFGFSIDLTNISGTTTNVLTNKSSNVILNGSQGSVTKLQFNNGATVTTNTSANTNVQGLIWQSGYAQSSTHVMCASSVFGSGRVFVITDSSPMDDGTGASGNNLYVSWPLYSHTQLFMNASLWLSKQQ